jgi:peptide chain release factor 1
MKKVLINRTTIHDCEVQTFHAGGPGGQNQNVRDTAARIIHHPSGARGESREQRSQGQNKRLAFRRMAESPQYRNWATSLGGTQTLPEVSSTERIRTYNLIDRRVTDHRTKHQSSHIDAILDGDIDTLYKE